MTSLGDKGVIALLNGHMNTLQVKTFHVRSSLQTIQTNHRILGLDYNHRTNTTGVYRITGGNHKGWSRWVDKELGNYDYLLGMDVCLVTPYSEAG